MMLVTNACLCEQCADVNWRQCGCVVHLTVKQRKGKKEIGSLATELQRLGEMLLAVTL